VIRSLLLGCAFLTLAVLPAEALRIVSPAPGATVRAGELITVQIALDPGESAAEVGVFNDGEALPATAAGATYTRQIRVPAESVGPDLLVAYAVLNGGGAALAEVQVNVDAGALRSLLVSVPPRFTAAGQTSGIEVRGVFADGVVRDLSSPEKGTTFSSSNAAVLAVHDAGIVQARANGSAELTVTSMGRTATAAVTVQIPVADTNRIPTIESGGDQTAVSEAVVTLSATATDPDGGQVEFLWDQVSGRVVVLHAARSASPQFVAPRTAVPQVLEFLVSARDARGATTLPILVRVNVNPATP
jgi:hypothetical protein